MVLLNSVVVSLRMENLHTRAKTVVSILLVFCVSTALKRVLTGITSTGCPCQEEEVTVTVETARHGKRMLFAAFT